MNCARGYCFAVCLPLVVLVTACQVDHAQAEIIYTTQSRFTSVSATTVFGNDQSVLSATNFASFVGDQDRVFQIGTASVGAAVTHSSSLLSTGLSVAGTLFATSGAPAGSSRSTSRSFFEVQFDLDRADLVSIDASSLEIEFGRFALTGPGIGIDDSIGLVGVPPRTSYSNRQIKQLEAGRYTAILDVTNGSATMGRSGSFQFGLQIVPEPSGVCVVFPIAWLAWRRNRNPWPPFSCRSANL